VERRISESPPPFQAVSTLNVPLAEFKPMSAKGLEETTLLVTALTPFVDQIPETTCQSEEPVVEVPRLFAVRVKVSATDEAAERPDATTLEEPVPALFTANTLT
jgi:hypothetical protein